VLRAEVAIIGGSGLCSIQVFKTVKTVKVNTPYGMSPELLIGEIGGRDIAFLPRHGKKHTTPPHLVNYRANIWALHKLGVKRILATTSCGSINPQMQPGELALLTQFIDFTTCRAHTFYEGGKSGVVHIDVTEPYCPELRGAVRKTAKKLRVKVHPHATYACTEGPRFETAAEIKALQILGSDLVGMTNVPECVLARELEMCYAAIGIITNSAAGVSKKKLTYTEVVKTLEKNTACIQGLLLEAIPEIPKRRSCSCSSVLKGAVVKV